MRAKAAAIRADCAQAVAVLRAECADALRSGAVIVEAERRRIAERFEAERTKARSRPSPLLPLAPT